jgi:uncharacterized protein
MPEVFLDTAYAVALSTPRDSFHRKAVELSSHLQNLGARLVTTRAVMIEIGNSLSDSRNRQMGVELLESLEKDPNVTAIPLSQDLFDRAFQLYKNRTDKEWGLTELHVLCSNDATGHH